MKLLQLVLALSVLILVHESGHFMFAKLFKIKVDKFFLFFDIGGKKLLSTKTGWFARIFPKLKNRETEYGIGWLPLGGYCKICGMVDESMDTEFLKSEPKPWEFRTKKAWQRLLVMVGGVLFNFILAILLGIASLKIWGETYYQNSETHIYASELAQEMGFKTGDRIISFDDYTPENFLTLQSDLARRNVRSALVERGGDTVLLYMDRSYISQVIATPGMFDIAIPFIVDTIPPESPNFGSGYLRGDRVIGIDSLRVEYLQDTRDVFKGHENSMMTATVIRGADTLSLPMYTDSSAKALIYVQAPKPFTKEYGLLASIPAGVNRTVRMIGDYIRDLRMVMSPSTGAYKSVGSFISIGDAFPSAWDWYRFIQLLALLSVMLGVMNLLPIPALDGGHIMFLLYEMITGRKPSDKFMQAAQMVGMVLILLLLLFACGNDVGRLFK